MIPRLDSSGKGSTHHERFHQRDWSRRSFLKAGAVLAGGAAGATLLPGVAGATGRGLPTQLPYTSPVLADLGLGDVPFFLPVEIDPFVGAFDPVANPSTFDDYNCAIGVLEIEGVSDDSNSDGVPRTWAADVRFMRGVFQDREGRKQRGAFGFF